MLISETVAGLQDFLKNNPGSIGFVPTMGALHEGHLSIISRAKKENNFVVCSIFVNPKQFNNPKDLINYPRTPRADVLMLEKVGCDMLFIPSVNEVYNEEDNRTFDFGIIETVMEGEFRPGHFNGVAKVITRLFDIVHPDKAYFGEKDFQQLAIIKELNRTLNSHVQIIGCETLRETDGLAMSSRNIHLTEEERKKSPVIYESLQYAASAIATTPIQQIKVEVKMMIEQDGLFKLQYFEIVRSENLQPVNFYDNAIAMRACIAVITSRTRLIDNIAL